MLVADLVDARSGQEVTEVVGVLADAAAAGLAFDALAVGRSCPHPSVGGLPLEIGPPTNVQRPVGGDRALAWVISSEQGRVAVVAVLAKQAVVEFKILNPRGVDPRTAPDPLQLARLGVERLLRA